MQHVAILLAGGASRRMGSATHDKILLPLAGRPAFVHALLAFARSGSVDAAVIVARDDFQQQAIAAAIAACGCELPIAYARGGEERADSVRAGLAALPSAAQWIYVHDLARPALRPEALRAVRTALLTHQCAVGLARRCTDTIREFPGDPTAGPAHGKVHDRARLWAMETPQAFPRELLERAHRARLAGATDDLVAVEAIGQPVLLVESQAANPKLTTAADIPFLEAILALTARAPAPLPGEQQPTLRVGFGYDIHRFAKGRPLVLGGVTIDHSSGLLGHSDADVLTHAIADAILGAAGLSDIGHYFPNSDPSIQGIDSLRILARAVEEAGRAGYHLLNVDACLIAEQPRIAPHIPAMRQKLAAACGLAPSAIGIKATTNESIGALGAGQGIAAHAVCALSR